MKIEIWQDEDGDWGWSIFDSYGDEVVAQDEMWATRDLARKEAYAALEDLL